MKTPALFILIGIFSTSWSWCQSSNIHEKSILSIKSESLTDSRMLVEKLDSMHHLLGTMESSRERADICYAISLYYADRLKIDSSLYYSEKVKKESEAANYELGMAKYYIVRSYALYFRKIQDPEGLNRGIEILKKYKDPALTGFAYRTLAKQYFQMGDNILARKYFHVAMDNYIAANKLTALQSTYYQISNSFSQSFEKDSAAFYLVKALQLAERMNDPARIVTAAKGLSELYESTGDLQNASRYLQYALDNSTPGINTVFVRIMLSNYIEILFKLGEFNKVEPLLKDYELANSQLGDNFGMFILQSIKGKYFFHKKNYSAALPFLRNAYSGLYSTNRGTSDMKINAWYLGQTEFILGQYDSAIAHFSDLLKLDNEMPLPVSIPEANLYLSQAYEKKGNKDLALYYLRAFNHLKDSMDLAQKDKMVMELTTKYATEKKEQQIQLLQREKELNAYQLKVKMAEIEKNKLVDAQQTQQLALLSQQSEINRLESARKTLALDNQRKEFIKTQSELALLGKENELQKAIAGTEAQRNRFAYILIGAIVLFSGLIYYRYTRTRQLSARLAISLVELKQAQDQLVKTEKEKEAENIRVRISRDIHDEVGATLSGVALFSEIAREKMKQHRGDDVQVYLEHITENSKEMVNKMSDIVWAINPENDSVDRIIAKLKSYAFNICAGKEISFHTSIDENIRSYFPTMQVKRNLYLFLKEAINNAVKYSEAGNITLLLQKTADLVRAEVSDDGTGFDPSSKNEGNGLKNMKARAGSLQGSFVITSTPGKGTSVSLAFNFHPAGGQEATI